MIHDYDAQTAVELPRIDSASGVTVGTSLLAAHAAETGLPAHINAALKFFASANDVLRAAVFSAAEASGDPTYLTESRREAAAWSTAWTWARSTAKLSHPKKSEAAKKILATLYPEGIAFVRLATAPRWVETERRLLAAKEEKLEALFALLGGADFLTDIIDAHKALGHAAGITAAPGVTMKSGVQAAFDLWKAAALLRHASDREPRAGEDDRPQRRGGGRAVQAASPCALEHRDDQREG